MPGERSVTERDNAARDVNARADGARAREQDPRTLALRLVAASARLNAIVLVTAIGLLLLGLWVHAGIKRSVGETRAAGLQAVLDAEVKALQLWIEDRKTDADHWAKDIRVRRHVAELARLASGRPDAEVLWNHTARSELAAIFTPVLKEAATFNVVDVNGVIIATQARDYAGLRVSPGAFLAHVAEVFNGAVRFVRPRTESERMGEARTPAYSRPFVWVKAPVRDGAGEIVAALSFAYPADGQFANIFSVGRPGATGEAYAFDELGRMLSESRFVGELRRAGLLTPGESAMLRIQIRDPGGDLAAGHVPELEVAARPLTRMAALAIASRGKTDPDALRGVILEPYRNYRGAEVIGGWRWLPEYDFGVAVEIGAQEAYAPLAYLNVAFALILSLLGAVAAAVLWSSFQVGRLRRQVGSTRQIGQYRIERQIGEGGLGTVYLARHALLKRPTALKMLKPHLASDEMVARFEREVQLASQLVHPNTIEIYDYGRTRDGKFYYVMEYLEGETLDRLVAAHGSMPAGRTIHVLRQVCAALREAHGRGLIHRDIKPHNIMLCHRGGEHDFVKILDFGLVKDTEGGASRDITQFQKMLGTPLYMSPERIRNPGDADARADIYAVGAVGFHLLTARELFEAGSDHDLTYQVLHTPPPRPSQFAPNVPRRLDDLIVRCLAKERSERPHDVLVVMALLDALSVEHPWPQREAAAWWQAHAAARGAAASA